MAEQVVKNIQWSLLIRAVFLMLCLSSCAMAQENLKVADSAKIIPKHNPGKALLMSAILPGAGQVYNRKYWKVPIIYAGFAACGYFINFNNSRYQQYRKAYILRADGDTTTTDKYVNLYSEANLLELKTYYRRNRDLTIIITTAVYVLNLLDAYVDAHLFNFNVNDNLSLQALPDFGLDHMAKPTAGIRLNFTFR